MESCNVLGKENEIKKEFNYLLKKYQDNQKEFLKDYDETIYNLIIWFIANSAILAPEAPFGCPMEIAPPLGFQRS